MIELGRSEQALPRELLESRGGFAWWYADLLDENRSGFVLIWGFGLPFLPGYADAARHGTAPAAGERPFVNLAVYKRGKLDGYWLTELGSDEAVWEPARERCRMGASVLESRLEQGHRRLEVSLDLAIPGSPERLTGTLSMVGTAVTHTAPEPSSLDHLWTPLATACEGAASLRVGGQPYLEVRGRGYHDRNGSSVPLGALGIEHWIWGRVPMQDHERIYYLLWPEGGGPARAIGVEVCSDGLATVVEDLEIELGPAHRARYGMRWWPRVTLMRDGEAWLSVEHAERVDDGPFYLRFVATAAGGIGPGVAEAVRPDRVDLARHRPLVRMRVQHTQQANSFFLPLFVGPSSGRLRRLLSQLWPSGASEVAAHG